MKSFEIGQIVKCINAKILERNEYGPSLIEGSLYTIYNIVVDTKGNQHLDVGLTSDLNYISSYETGEYLPMVSGVVHDKPTHWCHPSRFE